MSVKIYKLGHKCRWNILIIGDNAAVKFIRVHIRDVNRFWSSRRKLKSSRQIDADALAWHPLRPGIWGPLKAILLHIANLFSNIKKDFSTKVDSQNLFQSQNSQLHSFFTVLKNLDNHSRSSVNCTCALILWKSLKMVICSIKNFWNLCKKCFLITCITVYSLLFEKSCPVNLVYIFFCSAPP